MLESVAAGADNLSVEIMKDLTKVMLCGHAAYDETTGMLKSTNDAPPTSIGIAPEPWRHPDAKIAAAQEAYKAALKAAAPELRMPPASAQPVQTTTKRPGFLGEFFPVAVKSPEPERREKFVRARPDR